MTGRFTGRSQQVVADTKGVEIDALALVRDGRSEADDAVGRRRGGGRRGGVLRKLMMVSRCVRVCVCVVGGRCGSGGC